MKKTILIGLAAAAAAAAIGTIPTAQARDGCGRGYHRGWHDRCIPNGRQYRRAPVLVIGHYYDGRGYWDGRRYYKHRYRNHNGWRYR